MAEAMTAIERAAAQKDYAVISKYSGVADNSNLTNTISQPISENHYDTNIGNIKGTHAQNANAALNSARTGTVTTSDGRVVRGDGAVASFYTDSSLGVRAGAKERSGIDFQSPIPNQVTHKASSQLNNVVDGTNITLSAKNLDPTFKSLVSGDARNSNTSIVRGFD